MGKKKVKKLIPYLVEYICDECNQGKMKPTGNNNYLAMPPQIEHKCEFCGIIKTFYNERYPKIVYDEEDL